MRNPQLITVGDIRIRDNWCQEVATALYTPHLVSGSGYSLTHATFLVGSVRII
jgi:hypothetical protein